MTAPMTMRVVPLVGGPPGGPGPKGDNGNALRIDNVVSTASALPATPPEGENAVYAVTDENALYMWTSLGGWVKAADLRGTPGTDGADGQGLPAGGLTGQVPVKASNADYDIAWGTPLKIGTGDTDAMAGNKAASDLGGVAKASGITTVRHGTNAATARPAGADVVWWIGTVEPTNAVAHDVWDDAV